VSGGDRHGARLGEFLYRFRYPLSLICFVGAFLMAPFAQITRIDNDLTAWFSRPTRSIRTTNGSARNSKAPAR
jgi:hypothetical protein